MPENSSNADGASKILKRMELNVMWLVIFPSFSAYDPGNSDLKWKQRFHLLCLTLSVLEGFRCLTLAFTSPNGKLAYYLADFGPAFGAARDFFWLMGANYVFAGAAGIYHSYKHHYLGRTEWAEFSWTLVEKPRREPNAGVETLHEFGSERLNKLRKMVRLTLRYGVVFSLTAGFFYECIHLGTFSTYRPYSYIFTWSVPQMIQCFIVAYCHTGITAVSQILKFEITFLLVWRIDELREKMKKFQGECVQRHFSNDKLLDAFMREYVENRQKTINQNEFWKNVGGYALIFTCIGLLFNLHLQFFVPAHLYVKLGLLFWSIQALVVTIFVQFLSANWLRNSMRRLHPSFQRASQSTKSITLKLKIENISEDVAIFEPFTCLDILTYTSQNLILLLVELSMQFMLLIAVYSNRKDRL